MTNFFNPFSSKLKSSFINQTKNFEDILINLENGRKIFYKDTAIIKFRLADIFDLYFNVTDLIKKVASGNDKEHLILEILAISFRRIISSFFLLESGFAQEARMLLRNFLEYLLIAIDVTYNSASLIKWGETEQDNLEVCNDTWYFSRKKIIERINKQNNLYPSEEIINAKNINSEWINISNQILHAKSRAQTKNIIKQGNIELFGWSSLDGYKKSFAVYRELILALTNELIFIPKYKEKISSSKELIPLAKTVEDKFNKYQKIIACERDCRRDIESREGITRQELDDILKKYQINIDISSTSDSAKISTVEINVYNGDYNISIIHTV